jgi:hypothetical protein
VRPQVQRQPRHVRFFSEFVGQEHRLRKEVFFLAYHLHWGCADILDLATDDRWAFLRLLSYQLEREQEAIERARQRR